MLHPRKLKTLLEILRLLLVEPHVAVLLRPLMRMDDTDFDLWLQNTKNDTTALLIALRGKPVKFRALHPGARFAFVWAEGATEDAMRVWTVLDVSGRGRIADAATGDVRDCKGTSGEVGELTVCLLP